MRQLAFGTEKKKLIPAYWRVKTTFRVRLKKEKNKKSIEIEFLGGLCNFLLMLASFLPGSKKVILTRRMEMGDFSPLLCFLSD